MSTVRRRNAYWLSPAPIALDASMATPAPANPKPGSAPGPPTSTTDNATDTPVPTSPDRITCADRPSATSTDEADELTAISSTLPANIQGNRPSWSRTAPGTPNAPPSSGTPATAAAHTPPTANASHIPLRTNGNSSSGSSRWGATKGITPRNAPATVAVAGLNTAIVTANAASETVACRPNNAVSTSDPADAARELTYSGAAALAMVMKALRSLTPAHPASQLPRHAHELLRRHGRGRRPRAPPHLDPRLRQHGLRGPPRIPHPVDQELRGTAADVVAAVVDGGEPEVS